MDSLVTRLFTDATRNLERQKIKYPTGIRPYTWRNFSGHFSKIEILLMAGHLWTSCNFLLIIVRAYVMRPFLKSWSFKSLASLRRSVKFSHHRNSCTKKLTWRPMKKVYYIGYHNCDTNKKKNLGTWTTNAKYLVFQELSKNFPLMLALQKKFPFLIVLLTK